MKPYVYRYTSNATLSVASGAAYADVSGIAPWTAAGSTMRFKGFFTYTASANTAGLMPALNGPTPTFFAGRFSVQTAVAGTNTQTLQAGFRPAATGAAAGAASTTFAVVFEGLFTVGSSGGGLTVSFKGAGTAGTCTVASGGILLVEQLL